MLTTFEEVKQWIYDNNLKRWMLFRDYSKKEKILDSNAYPADMTDKIAMTEKYLRLSGGHAYASGGTTAGANDLDVYAEIQLQDIQPLQQQPAQTAGVGGQINEQQLRESIKRELEAEWDKRECKRLREELDKDRKAFEEEKNSAIGFITNILAPMGKAFLEKRVAGLDANTPVHADPVKPLVPSNEQEDVEEVRPFTDEEEEKLYALLTEFKSVEPQYMELLEAVVKMAKEGNTMYGIAKSTLLGGK